MLSVTTALGKNTHINAAYCTCARLGSLEGGSVAIQCLGTGSLASVGVVLIMHVLLAVFTLAFDEALYERPGISLVVYNFKAADAVDTLAGHKMHLLQGTSLLIKRQARYEGKHAACKLAQARSKCCYHHLALKQLPLLI